MSGDVKDRVRQVIAALGWALLGLGAIEAVVSKVLEAQGQGSAVPAWLGGAAVATGVGIKVLRLLIPQVIAALTQQVARPSGLTGKDVVLAVVLAVVGLAGPSVPMDQIVQALSAQAPATQAPATKASDLFRLFPEMDQPAMDEQVQPTGQPDVPSMPDVSIVGGFLLGFGWGGIRRRLWMPLLGIVLLAGCCGPIQQVANRADQSTTQRVDCRDEAFLIRYMADPRTGQVLTGDEVQQRIEELRAHLKLHGLPEDCPTNLPY